MRGILGARWLLGGNRRIGRTTSLVVVFLDKEISWKMKLRGRSIPVDRYDFDRSGEDYHVRSFRW